MGALHGSTIKEGKGTLTTFREKRKKVMYGKELYVFTMSFYSVYGKENYRAHRITEGGGIL